MPPKQQRPQRLSPKMKNDLKERRGFKSDRDGKRHRPENLEVHHKDRDTANNDPDNLRLLTPAQHDELHKRAGD